MWSVERSWTFEDTIELRVPKANSEVFGAARIGGQPAADAFVSITQSGGAGGWDPTAPTRIVKVDANGRFHERGLKAGTYVIRYRLGRRSGRVVLKVAADSVSRRDIEMW